MFSDTFDMFGVLSHGIVTFAKALLEVFDCVQSNHTVGLRGLLKGRNLKIMEVNARCSYFTKWLLELDRCKNKIFCPVVRTDELKLFVNERVLSVPPKINAPFYYLSPNKIPLATWENGKKRFWQWL